MSATSRATTGIDGLDDILHGGFMPRRLYLVEGMPGSGKTTLAFQFLLEGVRRGEPVLYVTLSETKEEIRGVAASHGWSLDGIAKKIVAHVDETRPTRVVFDSLSELRLLAGGPLHYRRQILALKQYFAGQHCTTLLLDDISPTQHDLQVQSIAHGALLLEHTLPAFGMPRRRLSVIKYRGSDFRGGYHDYVIRRGGITVFPRLVAAEHRRESSRTRMRSGLESLDALLGGGLEQGTSTLIQGAAGTGKSTISAFFAARAAERGEHATLFVFDESLNTLFRRMSGVNVDLREHVRAGRMRVNQVDPAELSPGEFAHDVRRAVEQDGSRIVVSDSLNGYLNSLPDDRFLILHLHELLTYLGQHGVATVMVAAHQGMLNRDMSGPFDASYLADAVVLLRYFEAEGEVRQALSVVKMRGGEHERSLREFSMKGGRISVGEPLRDYRGVLTGVPEKQLRT